MYYTDSLGITRPKSANLSFSASSPAHNLFCEFKAAFSVSRRLSRRGSIASQTTGVQGKLGRRNSGVGSVLGGFRPSLGSRQNSLAGRSGSGSQEASLEHSSKGAVSSSTAVAGVQRAAPTPATIPATQSDSGTLARPVSRQGQYNDEVTAADGQNNADFLGSIKEHQENP